MADTSLNAAYYKTLRTRINDGDCAETREARTNTYFLEESNGNLKGAWTSRGYRGGVRTRVMKKNDCQPNTYARPIPEICSHRRVRESLLSQVLSGEGTNQA